MDVSETDTRTAKTCFRQVNYELSGLINYIVTGDIGLPDIQRPFVWNNTKVRDLFDSMFKGFPIGYLLFWENGQAKGARQIGTNEKAHAPLRLIVDGQQRLTSLYAVFKGIPVLDADYKERRIEIAFRPRDAQFEVCDATTRRDPEWLADISAVWASGRAGYSVIRDFLKRLGEKVTLTDEEEAVITRNLDRLINLDSYPFTALEINSGVDEEQVANIFVRINSEGVKLNQADFILTLLSVFWENGRKELESFCRAARAQPVDGKPSPYNHFIKPGPDQLLRVGIAVGFNRARLKSVYQILRGKDVETGEFSKEHRDAQFKILDTAQAKVLNLNNWHQFLSALVGAGYRSTGMISSENALLYAYAFYLLGRETYGVPQHALQKAIGRWFFASSLTGRYTGSPESVMDGDLNRLKAVKDADGFLSMLDTIVATTLTNDFWTITLPSELDTSSANSPALHAYVAAQNRLGAPVLFSHKRIPELLDPSLVANRSPLERHHLFPRNWLKTNGVEDKRIINQMANYALLEWPENMDISDDHPSVYVPRIRERIRPADWQLMHEMHALPDGWEKMDYDVFLEARRKLMAHIIRRGFETLSSAIQ